MSSSDSEGPADRNSKKRKLDKKATSSSKNEEETDKIDLGSMRFVNKSEFKGKLYVNIREYYKDKDTGEMKPGKKGIALTPGQWKILQENREMIDKWIQEG